ncbi:hypothetical protein BDY19DRAFT_987296 [Irpex rosettiformis]|uniref:Uncharacterized protein n=1 Tax=Irpex rosettiformis TaxID=378272 RepID=A0ACB8TSQ3_9APHY|nr:hypothetical protein BDY19DRAFT_987296 [Irpex rosettiformis]
MSHRRNFSSRAIDMAKISLESPPVTPALAVFNVFQHEKSAHSNKTKQYWQRTTFLALFALILISGYVLLISPPSLSQITHHDGDQSFTGLAAQRLSRLSNEAYRLASSHRKVKGQAAPNSNDSESFRDNASSSLQLTPEQELAVVTSFLASLAENIIPSNVDPSRTIDPELVLDFNTRGPHAVQELEQLVADSWVHYPVVLYSKLHSPVSRDLKKILSNLNLKPSPTVIEVEDRPDEDVLKPLLLRLTKSNELPILLIGGKTVGTFEEIQYMYKKGDLARAVITAGAIVDGGKKGKGRKH